MKWEMSENNIYWFNLIQKSEEMKRIGSFFHLSVWLSNPDMWMLLPQKSILCEEKSFDSPLW